MMNRGKRTWLALWLASALISGVTSNVWAQEKSDLKLRVGDVAPDFKLQYFDGNDLKDVHLSDFRGKKNVVLAFYVFAFTGG